MAKLKKVTKRKPLKGVRLPLPKQKGGKHKVKTKYDRKRVGNFLEGLDPDVTAMLKRVDELTRERGAQ